MEVLGLYNYWVVVVLMMAGFWIVVAQGNLVKKVIGLALFQGAVFIFFISLARLDGGTAPIVADLEALGAAGYANPLPHVLILTAIVVGVAVTAVALALVVRIREAYGTIEEDDIYRQDPE